MSLKLAVPGRRGALALVPLIAACLLTVAADTAQAQQQQQNILDSLLEKLKDKGVLTQDEYDALKAARDEERTQERAERRKQALKAAQEEEKQEKAKEAQKSTLVGRWNNGFVLESGDKQHSIGINGRIQADYRAFDPSGAAADTFDIRRAYITLTGKVWNDFTFDVTADLASQSGTSPSHLDVAWLNWGHWKEVQLRAGQFKMPFSLDQLTSSRFIDFQERSMVDFLVPAKERGAMVHGQPFTGVTYGVALSNGQGKNNNDTNSLSDGKDVIGRATLNLAELLDQQKQAVYHVGAAYSYGNWTPAAAASVRTEARGLTFFAPSAFTSVDNQVERTRTGLEGSVAYGPVKLQSEWVKVNYQGRSRGAGNPAYDKDQTAYYVEALWLLTGEKYADAYRNGVYGRIVPKSNFDARGGWGAWELGLRYSKFDAHDFPVLGCTGTPADNGTGQVRPTCSGGVVTSVLTNGANAYSLGLKWIMNPNVRFYLNYIETNFDTPVVQRPGGTGAPQTFDKERSITMRAGIDF